MKLNFESPTGIVWSMIVPDGTVVTVDSNPKPTGLPVGMERSYASAELLATAVKLLKPKQTIVCDVTTLSQGVDPVVHYGSNLDGSVTMWSTSRVMQPPVAPPTPGAPFAPIFPGISTPELPYGPPHAVPGESDLSQMFRAQIAANNGQPWPKNNGNGDDELAPVYQSESALLAAINTLQYKYKVTVNGAAVIVSWPQFGPATDYKRQPDGSVVRA